METLSVKILEPKVRRILDDLESLKLIQVEKLDEPKMPKRRFGSMKGLVEYIADDFDAPLDDLKEYL
jgi:hypothetical protein